LDGDFVGEGSTVLAKINNKTTPGVDLLVRESIQNTLDEIRPDKTCGIIDFSSNTFKKSAFASTIPQLESAINGFVKETLCHFLVISDSNTNGLLGEPYKRKDKPNNLYNLVYDIDSHDKKDQNVGGSWGIGKSVYYRYGIGFVFYYTRTFEDGQYQEKLAGVLIQDEKSKDCLLGPDTTGICFIGDTVEHEGKKKRWPIYDSTKIQEFLDIFGIARYNEQQTGTKVIIPFLNSASLIQRRIYEGTDLHWNINFEDCFSMAIQRWWFPRLNNSSFKGKMFIAKVNGKKVELNPFFSVLQRLFNNDPSIKESAMVPITNKKSGTEDTLGYLFCLKGEKSLFNVCVPPENLSNPYAQIDVAQESGQDNPVILAYMRRFGLVVDYDIDKCKLTTSPNEYLIALFVLNDDARAKDNPAESLGRFLKASENPDHKGWRDIDDKRFPSFSDHRPASKIFKRIKNYLEENYKEHSAPDETYGPALLRRKVGKILLPPSDFGDAPEKEPKIPKRQIIKVTHKRPSHVAFNGLLGNLLSYDISFALKPSELGKAKLNVVTNSGNFNIVDWERDGFASPIRIKKVTMKCVEIDKDSYEHEIEIPQQRWGSNQKIRLPLPTNPEIEITVSKKTPQTTPHAVYVKNLSQSDLRYQMTILVEPLNLSYQMTVVADVEEAK
ncbi:MAG: hypothetical protein SPL80_07095, partial [Bacilli bacterium]|nr:hypothetical protein [Bacilli bacterium]